MDTIIVGVIIACAVIYTVRRCVRIYKRQGSCECGQGCSCQSKDNCGKDTNISF
ncbi:MAG: FeoB-associated Cys-rich membrane protein [Desulfobacteraceae bacterium]|nr:FeoB-associated Cys-rich membrane protein [Desulfobacteraceae bacterium]